MAPPSFDENLGFLEGVEDLPIQELGLRQQMHQMIFRCLVLLS